MDKLPSTFMIGVLAFLFLLLEGDNNDNKTNKTPQMYKCLKGKPAPFSTLVPSAISISTAAKLTNIAKLLSLLDDTANTTPTRTSVYKLRMFMLFTERRSA